MLVMSNHYFERVGLKFCACMNSMEPSFEAGTLQAVLMDVKSPAFSSPCTYIPKDYIQQALM